MPLTHRLIRTAALVAGSLLTTVVSVRLGLGVDVVKRAANIPEDAEGVGQFVNGAKALVHARAGHDRGDLSAGRHRRRRWSCCSAGAAAWSSSARRSACCCCWAP